MMFAEVIVDIAHSDVDRIYDYACGEDVVRGMRVVVPFGKGVTTGFVMRVKERTELDPARIRKILRYEEELPPLTAESLFLAEKISARYRVPMALTLRLFLPSEMRTGKVSKRYETVYLPCEGRTEEEIPPRAVKQRALFRHLTEVGEEESARLREEYGSAVKALSDAGFLRAEKRRVFRDPYRGASAESTPKKLTPSQQNAVDTVKNTDKTVTLLHGVTGSGKTEVYLSLIADTLKADKTAIFLVPEISLTPQMLSQLRARFGSAVAILHSGLSAGERYDEWLRLREGEAKIAVGARSAVFAPVERVGLLVIDEEHDGSYSSETAPRYETFGIALMRARYNGCKLVLGSATPSVETYRRAVMGEFELVKLPERINARPMPEVKLVDMRREVRRGNASPFSELLSERLGECLKKGNQAILFLNRRGYAKTVICRDCGYVAKCTQCDVALTYHSDEGALKCHYCGSNYRMPPACPACGGRHLGYEGVGTQRIVLDLKKRFPAARILRMDVDTTSGKEGHYRILKQFASHEADILVGTQMVAKGHDFPSVTLVGILDADMSLHFADYRSGERTFQLVTQVAGRSGRAQEPGEVVLQTYDPENAILRSAAAYDYEGFYAREISMREAMLFPPFAKIVRVMVTGEEEGAAVEVLRGVYTALKELYDAHPEEFLFFNRMHSPIKRIRGKYRYQVLMRLLGGGMLKEIYRIASEVRERDVLVYVEEDPANLS